MDLNKLVAKLGGEWKVYSTNMIKCGKYPFYVSTQGYIFICNCNSFLRYKDDILEIRVDTSNIQIPIHTRVMHNMLMDIFNAICDVIYDKHMKPQTEVKE